MGLDISMGEFKVFSTASYLLPAQLLAIWDFI